MASVAKKLVMVYVFRLKRRIGPIIGFIVFACVFLFTFPMLEELLSGRSSSDSGLPNIMTIVPKNSEAMQYCRSVPLFLDQSHHPPCERRTVSVVYVTKRPGGYDMLFNSLQNQTDKDYELICVDELAPYRATRVREYAKEKGINLVDIVASKPKSVKMKDAKFGIYKAINTGLLLTSGSVITILMDFAWVPYNFVERTKMFYKEHPRSFLAYPEYLFSKNNMGSFFGYKALEDPTALSIFKTPITKSPQDSPDEGWFHYVKRPESVVDRRPGFEKQNGPDTFWEMSFASAPWSAYEELNGVDEHLDVGDDCHEVNMRLRAEMFLGYDLWIDGQVLVDQVQHRVFKATPEWHRYAEDANWERYMNILKAIRENTYPLQCPLAFNFTLWRKYNCRIRAYGYDIDC